MFKLLFRMPSVTALTFAVIFIVLLISPLSLSLQTSSFSLSLDLDGSEGDQAVQSLVLSPNQDVSIQVFGTDIQTASGLSARFEYDVTQVVYEGFDAGDVLPNPIVRLEEGTNSTVVVPPDSTSFIEINIASLDSSATVSSGLVGTIRFHTTDAFSQTEILLVRAELSRSGQVESESAMLNIRVALHVAAPPSPDFDGSGFVDFQDLSLLTKVFGYQEGQEGYEAKYDLNGDGEIRTDDFLIFIQSYGKWVKHAPVFTSRTYVTHFIDENTPGGEPIGSPISATDADGDILTYHLSGKDADLFAIDAGTGQIQTREGITYDYEYRTTYSVIVEVSDGQGGTARLLVIIKINDLKEPPSSPPSNFLVIPDDQSLTVHYATVPDERGRPPVRGYHAEIRKGEDGTWGDRKTIYGRTNTSVYYHELKVPRYHDPYLINGQLYQVHVRTWNSDGAGEWSEPVSGTPVYVPPKKEPQLTQFQGEDNAIIDLSPSTGEGGRIRIARTAFPATISQEEVEGVFVEIVKVAVSNAPDVLAQAGFTIPGSSSLFDIDLKARVNNQDVDIDGALRASVEICLPVPEDISDPVLVHYEEGQSTWEMLDRQRVDGDVVCGYTDRFSLFGVGERANRASEKLSFDGATMPAQTYTVGTQIDAIQLPEATGGTGTINYTLTPALPDGLMLDEETLTISGMPIVASEARDYKWKATDKDENTIELVFSIVVKPANQIPIFSEGASTTRAFAENTEADENIGNPVTATDNDGGTLTYNLQGPDADSFSIVSTSGQLQTREGITYNYEAKNSYSVIVRVVDGQGGNATIGVAITVTDVTEKPGTPAAPTLAEATFNSLKISWSAPTNTGPSISAYDVRYILSSASEADKADDTKWTEVTDAWTSGDLIYTISSLSTNTRYDIQVLAESDEGMSAWSDTVEGMTNQNQAPVFAAISPVTVSENSIGDIVTVSASDADAEDSIAGYGIVAGADGSQFEITSAGVLTFKVAPNYEAPTDVLVSDPANDASNNEYIVYVEATSGTDARALTTTVTVTVTVEDVIEKPGTPAAPQVAEATFNSLKISWSAPTNTGPAITAYDVRHILSSASDADKADDSKWTALTDAWTSSNGGDLAYTISSLSTNTSYDVQVLAENAEGMSAWSASVTGTTSANVAPVITSASSFTVSENSTADIVTVSASDADTGDDIESYGIVDAADGDLFSIGSSTGVLTFKVAPNYEAPTDVLVSNPSSAAANNEYIVIVTGTSGEDARELTATVTVTVTVKDVTEQPGIPSAPQVAEATFNSLKISWSAPANTGPAITAYDVRHILSSASDADKADDSKWTALTDAWTSSNGGDLAYTISSLSTNTSYDVQVLAESDEGMSAWSASVTGTTSANVAPVITSASSFTVSENSTADIVTVTASDADTGDDIESYGIVDAADGDRFSIVTSTGVLTFKVAPNYEAPTDVLVSNPSSAAANNEYIVIVTGTSGEDARELTATVTVTVTVMDVIEEPGTPAAPMIAQATFNSLKISWSAPTNTGPAISSYDVRYILSSASDADKADDSKWTALTDAWTSSNGGDLAYTISSLSTNTSYDVQVLAESDEGTSAWSASVTGTTSANVAPVITSASSFTVSENSTADIVTVSASDADTGDDIESYGIVDAADGDQFSIVSSTGVLTFKVAPNYEAPTDVLVSNPSSAAANNEYIVIVTGTSGEDARELTATQTVTVTVMDVTEQPGKPAAPMIAQATFNSLKISWSAPTNTGPAISSYDVRYILSSASDADKADDSKWTALTDAWTSSNGGDLAYTISSLSTNTSYDVQVLAESDEGMSAWSDTVEGMTNQNQAPVFAAISPITVSENSIGDIVTVSASDADAEDSITGYGIASDADGSQFEITSAGVLTFKVAPNYEDRKDVLVSDPANAANNNEYIVIVTGTSGEDARELTATVTVTVTVMDVIEEPGTPAAPMIAQATFNSLKISWTAPTNTGPAISAYDVRYILTSASDEDKADDTKWIEVTDAWTSSNGGALEYTLSPLAQETGYDIQVRAESDEGTSVWSDTVTGTTSANVAPVIASISPITVSENSIGALVTVSASDADTEDTVTGYAIVPDADGGQFSIGSPTGVLTFKVAPNYEAPTDVLVSNPSSAAANNEYIVFVTATGGASARELTATVTVTVTVKDVTEQPGIPSAPQVAEATFNSLKISWSAPANTGPAITAYDVRHILSSASDADKADDSKWTALTDAWTSSNGGDLAYTISSLSTNTSYDVQVLAESDEGMSAWSDTVEGMTNQNQAPVFAAISPITVSENSTADIVTVSASDADTGDDIESYGIVDAADGDQFSIVSSTGVLTFKVAPNYEAPTDVLVSNPSSAAANNEYIVIVTGTSGEDARELTATVTVTVTVMDVIEEPGTPAAPMIAQATFNSLKISWSAPTNTGPAISAYDVRYILSSASDADKADDSKWTALTDAWTSGNGGDLAYTISSLSTNTSYDVQVLAESDEGTSAWSASVTGTTSANVAPVITSASSFTVSENSTADIVTVTASDADTGDDIESYGIAADADGGQFSIGSSTGVLTFKVAPNYEAPTDVLVSDPANDASNNEYIVIVTATSGASARELTATVTVTVTVMDVIEEPGTPAAPMIAQATFNSLKISWSAPTNTGPAISAYDVRYILSSASDADKADDSKWTALTDAWTSGNGGDLAYTISSLSTNTSYDVQVLAESDEGTSAWSASVTGTTSANVAPVITSASSFTVSENSTADIVTVTASDADTGDDIESYGIAADADGGQFSIGSSTGVLTFKVAPNYEAPTDVSVSDPANDASNNEYIVYVEATSGTDARALTTTVTVTVTVEDVTEQPGTPAAPQVAQATFNSLKISWSAPTNTGPAITAYDVRYILSSASDADKADDTKWTEVTDAWTSSNGGALEYTISPLAQETGYDIQVRAESDEGTSVRSDTVTGTTTQNQAPVFAAISPITVSENSTAALVTVSASDADAEDSITGYGIVAGADGSQFSIHDQTGVLTFKASPNYEAPTDVLVSNPSSAASDNEYIVIVTGTSGEDARELTATVTVTVTVMDVDTEKPGTPAAPQVAEATFNSLKISWSAPTNTGPSISAYDVRHILSSASDEDKADDSKWTALTDAWTSSNGGDLAYTISSLSTNTSYDVQVLAESDEGTSAWSASVTGTTSANVAPVITSASSFTVSENSTADIVTVSASDADTGDDIESYGIAADADGGQFSIGSSTGVLTFKVAPNYEAPTDVSVSDPANDASNNEYIVYVEATSGTDARALTTTVTVTVTVEDVIEKPGTPAAPQVAEATFNSLKISWSAPANTGPAITAYDVRHILSSASDADKADDSKWTALTDAWTSSNGGDLAYTISSLSTNTSYDVQVLAESDEGTSAWSASVTGTTSANVAPVITSASSFTVSENSTADIVTVSASDADTGDDIESYGIVDAADGDQFSIVSSTGVLTFKVAPNYEAPTDVLVSNPSSAAANNEYIVIVTGTSGEDARELTATVTVTVTVMDVIEEPGTPAAPMIAQATFNSLKISWSAPTNTGPAISAYDVRYILSSASDADKADDSKWTALTDAWTSGNGGDLAYTISSLSTNTSYDVQVLAESDEGTSAWSASVTGTTRANVAPVITSASSFTVSENSTADIVTVSASDADTGDDIESYGIVDAADGDLFSIGSSTGVLTFKVAPNYEAPTDVLVSDPANDASNNEYIVIISATGGADARALTTTVPVTVTVEDVTEPPDKPAAPQVAQATFNSLKVEWTAPTNTGPSISAYDVRHILSSASDEDKADDSKWTALTDAWTSSNGGDLAYTISSLSTNTSYDVQVLAENAEGMSAWSASVTGTTSANVAPVITSASSFTVSENSTADIVTVSASDADTGDDIESYGIVDAADGDLFSIGSSTGVLTFKVAPNYEAPTDVLVSDPANDASNNEYIVYVEATSGTDARALTTTVTVTVTVEDVIEKPGTPAAPQVAEATFNSLKISWSAPTNTGPAITAYDVRYILSSASDEDKADDSKWTEVEDAWTSGNGGDLEYTISPLAQETGYDIQVRAESDEGMSDWSASVTGMTTQNQAPVFAAISPITVSENSTADIVTVSASDADAEDSITGYGIVAGADGSQFSIHDQTGVLTFKVAPNYEDPKDVAVTDPANNAADNEYIVIVSATGGADARALTATQTVTVTVKDVTEPPDKPAVPVLSDATLNSLKVSWTVPANTGPEISSYDVRYILSSASETDKADDSKWTEVTDAWTSGSGALEYTISPLSPSTSYDVQVLAESDEGTSVRSDTVTGTTTQNQVPVFAAISPITVSENSTAALVTVSASDADAEDSITGYGIVAGADGSQFSINDQTGVLTFKVAPNYEAPTDVLVSNPSSAAANNEYIVIVTGTSGEDARELTATQTLTITVMDVDTENPGTPAAPQVAQATLNSLKISWSAPTNTGPDISAYDVRYILSSASGEDKADDSKWTALTDAWTSGSGVLEYTISPLSPSTSYDVQVLAESDEGMSAWSDTVEGMTNQNQAPVFAAISPITVSENSTAALVTVSASDADAEDSITGYGIVAGADGSQFEITSAGVLTFKVAPNYEDRKDVLVSDPANDASNNEYIVIVTGTSGEDARELTATVTVTVTVMDVDTEKPGTPAAPQVAEATFNSLKVEWTAPTNTGPAITAYDVRHILTSASDEDKADDSKWTALTDAWTSSNGGDLAYTISSLSTNTSYDIQVLAESVEGMSAWSDTVEGMTNQNQAPVFASISPITVSENSTAALVTVSASDADAEDSITSYGIAAGADGGQFSIGSSTGVLTFKVAPNYEAPTDVLVSNPSSAASDNEYIVIVTGTSGEDARELTATVTLTVTVMDVDTEKPGKPATPTIAEATFNSLKISWTAPTNTGPAISAYDVRYILTSASDEDKADDTKWIEVTDVWTSGDLTYTIGSLSQNTGYDIQVRAENDKGGTSDWSASVTGTTRANVVPVIASISPITVNENSTAALVTVSATDADTDDSITGYAIASGADGAQFSLGASTGVLTFKTAPNYEAPTDVLVSNPSSAAGNNEYIVFVTATGGENTRALTARNTLTITVSDVVEKPVTPAAPTIAEATFNSLKISWTAPTGPAISAYDVRHILSSASETDKANDTKWTVVADAWTSGDLTYTISSLSTNTRYDVQVRAESDEGYSAWSESWEGTTSDDYDKDDDGLIEVSTLEQLNAIRYDLDGNGTVDDATNASTYALAFPSATSGMGCPQSGCKGYELTTALDFDNSSWNTGSGWEPLGTSSNKFTAIFDGGGNILSNLLINRSGSAGLFGESSGSIKNVGLVNVDVNGTGKVGGLLGKNDGKVSNCFVTGQVSSSDGAGGLVGSNSDTIRTSYSKVDVTNTLNGGGLVGDNEGVLLACYATGQVSTSRSAGGLVGFNSSSASIKYCYATGSVSSSGTGDNGRRVGGFFGGLQTPSSSSEYGLSYWNTEMTGQSSRAGGRFSTHSNSNKIRDYIKGKTTSQLRSPTGYSGIYGTWDDEDTTGDEMADAPWDFIASQYPVLKVDFNGDGNATFQEFGTQGVFSAPTISSVTLSGQQLTVVWDPPSDQGSSAISAYDVRYISESADQSVNANWTEVTDAWTSGNLEYTITGLSNSLGGYAVQVRVAMGLSRWSEAKFTHAMTWVNFAQAKQNNEEPILPDFSYAGYHYFAKPVPDVTHTEFDVTDYGAFPNDNQSDHRAIQDAIDAAVANGSGVVKFPAGEFLINTDQDYPGQIFVRGSNIVLRGAGSRDGGTIIRQVNFLRSPSSAKDANPYCLVFDGSSNGASEEITRVTEDAERETFWITVADASSLNLGQRVELVFTSVQAGIDYVAPLSIHSGWSVIRNNGLGFREQHTIDQISGNRVKLKEPLHGKIKASYSCVVRKFFHIEEVGIEDISIQGSFLQAFAHHRDDIHNSGWGIIEFKNCVNSWMRRVTVANMSRLTIARSLGFSAYHITADGNPGHYFVRNRANYGLWFGLSEEKTNHSDSHNLNCLEGTTGTVYHDIVVRDNANMDSHSWFPYANLYDIITGGKLDGSGGSTGSFPNHLRHLVFWNHEHKVSRSYNFPGTTLSYSQAFILPIVVGIHGTTPTFNSSQLEVLESLGTEVLPHSLFDAQLELRLGSLPSWYENLKTEWQTIKGQSFTPPRILVETVEDFFFDVSNVGSTSDLDLSDFVSSLHSITPGFTATSNDVTVATATISGSVLTVTVVGAGNTSIEVTASGGGESTSFSLDVSVKLERPVIRSILERNNALYVHWHDPLDINTNDYDIRYKSGSLDWTTVEGIGTTGKLEYEISGLTNTIEYEVQVRTQKGTSLSQWSETFRATPVATVDYDSDGNGLIEIRNWTQLYNVYHDPDGNGVPTTAGESDYTSAFPDAVSGMGCPTNCTGYELVNPLDFDDSGLTNWRSIGEIVTTGGADTGTKYSATFHGNGNVISDVVLSKTLAIGSSGSTGFFGVSSGTLKNIGLKDINFTGKVEARDHNGSQTKNSISVGGIVGTNEGKVVNCFVTGQVNGNATQYDNSGNPDYGSRSGSTVGLIVGDNKNTGIIATSYADGSALIGVHIGGVVGTNSGQIIHCYVKGSVRNGRYGGGFTGWHNNGASVKYSYTATEVFYGGSFAFRTGAFFGGFRGTAASAPSYWDNTIHSYSRSGTESGAGQANFSGQTTSNLKSPTGYTGIYSTWNTAVTVSGITIPTEPWDFGTSNQYPALKVDFDNDGTATVEEFGHQR